MSDPMTPNQLLAALSAEGLSVAEHSHWRTHERDSATGKPFGPVHGVVVHHTAGLNDLEYIYSGSAALPGPLAHGFIAKSGVVTLMSAGRANHAGGGDPNVYRTVVAESYMTRPSAPRFGEGDKGAMDGNDVFYGWECENLGDGKDPWPHEQYVAMVKASAAICRHYGWSAKSCIGHLEWSNQKNDPRGFSMVTFRGDLANCLRAKPKSWPTVVAPPPVKPTPPPAPKPALTVEQRLERIEKLLKLT